MSTADVVIDVCGHCCPVPLIQLAKAAAGLVSGQTITITGDDPIFAVAVRDFCEMKGHAIIEEKLDGRKTSYLVRISG
jgi:tRNA 2-thiouridine synthesizing protein A